MVVIIQFHQQLCNFIFFFVLFIGFFLSKDLPSNTKRSQFEFIFQS